MAQAIGNSRVGTAVLKIGDAPVRSFVNHVTAHPEGDEQSDIATVFGAAWGADGIITIKSVK
jgi:hypothetical protein